MAQSAQAAIREQYRDPDLCLDDVAQATGVSPRHLQRVLRTRQGESFRAVLLRTRMERARQLLEGRSSHSIQAVARMVGYRQASGLRQAFVRFWGVQPSSVRRPWDSDAQYDAAFRRAEARDDQP